MSTDSSEVYAVIRSGGKQYRVAPGQRVRLERLDGDAGDAIRFDEVLLVSGGGEVAVGAPIVESASVSGEILEQGRGRKINVFKYKNKTRYRRLRGHRQLHTAVLVNEVSLGDQTWTAPVREDLLESAADEAEEPVEAIEEAESDTVADPADESTGGEESEE